MKKKLKIFFSYTKFPVNATSSIIIGILVCGVPFVYTLLFGKSLLILMSVIIMGVIAFLLLTYINMNKSQKAKKQK